jgi:hypothetical protein
MILILMTIWSICKSFCRETFCRIHHKSISIAKTHQQAVKLKAANRRCHGRPMVWPITTKSIFLMKNSTPQACAAAILSISLSLPAYAGRPLSVDDANINDVGAGHVEAWYAHMSHGVNTWNMAPAYSPVKDFEVSGLLSRNQTELLTTSALQIKWRITPSNPEGCNLGMVVGVSHLNGDGGNTPYLNGIASCNHKGGAMHWNLGVARPDGGKNLVNWGIAYERELGSVIAHIEYFGQESGKPTAQIGMRHDLVPGLQLDGTVGRSDGDVIFSLGLKKSF